MRRLLIRPGGIGDCILCFPAMGHLCTEYTEVWISPAVMPLVQFADVVRPISSTGLDLAGLGDLPMPARVEAELCGFDSIVSWYGSGRPEFRAAIEHLGVPCVFHPALPPQGCPQHAGDFFAAQVGAPSGLTPRLKLDSQPKRNTVVIHPFSGSPRKNWPLENYRELARDLPCAVEWSAGPEEPLQQAQRFDDLYRLAEWIGGARLYIGNDSGITHLAAATGVPVLALFGPTDPALWAPRGPNVSVMRSESLSALPLSVCRDRALELLRA